MRIPNTVTLIRENAFNNTTALTKLTIGNGVTDIEEGAFAQCTALTQMTVHPNQPPVVGEKVFENVSRSIPVFVPDRAMHSYSTTEVWKEFNLQIMSSSALTTHAMPESIGMQNGTLHNPQSLTISIYDMQGRMVYQGNDTDICQPTGVYVIHCNGASGKVLF